MDPLRIPTVSGWAPIAFAAVVLALLGAGGCGGPKPPQEPRAMSERPSPDASPVASSGTELATFGGGCFWCMEAVYERLEGVLSVTSGYAGGQAPSPTYDEVCTGRTGHAEVVQIRYDPTRVSYEDLLEVFFRVHDPTTPNRQGHDVGTQYRSIVLWHDEAQRETAERVKKALDESGVYDKPVVTEIVPYESFTPAEDYHQDYFARHGRQPYCEIVIQPKVEKFEQVFHDRLKARR